MSLERVHVVDGYGRSGVMNSEKVSSGGGDAAGGDVRLVGVDGGRGGVAWGSHFRWCRWRNRGMEGEGPPLVECQVDQGLGDVLDSRATDHDGLAVYERYQGIVEDSTSHWPERDQRARTSCASLGVPLRFKVQNC